jgi:acetoin utilization deacetylase AcuC-like enzyme
MPIVHDPTHVRHRPRTELLYGKPAPHPDQPARVETIVAALRETPWATKMVAPKAYPLEWATRVHEAAYVEHLVRREIEVGQMPPDEEWFPYTWPAHRSLDTGTPLLGITREVAWNAACVALTGADLLLAGASFAYALCRPPGHHAARGAMGGYCYFNNAAVAADYLLRCWTAPPSAEPSGSEPSSIARRGPGEGPVAILDLDVHHGNGTQDIFYSSDRVLYCSIHGEPEWAYPPHTGYAEEAGAGAGHGWNYNQPLPQGTSWDAYSAALDRALERIATVSPSAVVLSQGFDTFEGDRWGGFLLHAEHFAKIGARVRSLGVPVLAVLEGGYEPANLAAGSLALLDGLSS